MISDHARILPWNRSGVGLDCPSSCYATKAGINPRIAIFAHYHCQTANFSLEGGRGVLAIASRDAGVRDCSNAAVLACSGLLTRTVTQLRWSEGLKTQTVTETR